MGPYGTEVDPAPDLTGRRVTVFAAFDAWAHEDKAVEAYEFNDPEGEGPFQDEREVRRPRSYA